MYQPGDIVQLDGTGDFAGIEVIVMEVDLTDGRITKIKAVVPNDRLGKAGFILEGEDWVAVEYNFCPN